MTDEQLIASAQALLDLDARGALVPHGIGGHARTIIEGFLALYRRVPASGGKLTRYAMETLTGGTIPLPVVRDYGEWVKFSDLAVSPIVAAPEGSAASSRSFEEWATEIGLDPTAEAAIVRISRKAWKADLAAASSIPEGKAEPGEAAVIERTVTAIRNAMSHYQYEHKLNDLTSNQQEEAIKIALRALSTPVKP